MRFSTLLASTALCTGVLGTPVPANLDLKVAPPPLAALNLFPTIVPTYPTTRSNAAVNRNSVNMNEVQILFSTKDEVRADVGGAVKYPIVRD